jgi:hypothetical protein
MIEIRKIAPGVLSMKVAGKLGKEELERAADALEIALDENEKTHLLGEVADFQGIEIGALADYLPRALAMIRKIDRFGRVALVSDRSWIRWAARLESALLPHIRYETYVSAERDQALAWVSGETELPHGPALKLIDVEDPSVLAYEVDGKISAAELDIAARCFAPAIARGEKLRALGRFRRFAGFEPGALLCDEYLRMKRDLLGRVERYALVGAPAWICDIAVPMAPMFGVELRCFELEEEPLAWAWLGTQPKQERALVA